MGHCENINDYTQFIDNYENGCHCYNMGVEGLADGLSTLMKYVSCINCSQLFINVNFLSLLRFFFSPQNSYLGSEKFEANKVAVDQY